MTTRQTVFLGGVLVAAVTFGVFSPTLSFDFVNWDDNLYVYQNPRLHPLIFQNILWLFTHPYFLSWTPIALLSHALDLKLWGISPFGHHLTNILLHSVNAGLVFWLALTLRRRDKNVQGNPAAATRDTAMVIGAAVASLLFSLHPLRAESVAWVSDRKDLLCTCFMLLSTILFIARRNTQDDSRGGYFAVLVFYVLALGTKSVAAVLPAIFIMMDVLVFRRKLVRSIRAQIPFLVLGLATVIIASIAATGGEKNFLFENKSVWEFLVYPFTTLVFYLRNTFVPVDLVPVYMNDTFLPTNVFVLLLAPLIILAISAFSWMKYKRGNPYLLLGWSAFVLFLIPTMVGIFSGIQPVADRYTYSASIGICLLVGGGVEYVVRKSSVVLVSLISVCLLFVLSYGTIRQMTIWKDSLTLWSHTVQLSPFHFAYNNLGMAQLDKKMTDEAIVSFKKAVAIRPTYGEAWCNLGIAFHKKDEPDKAIASYEQAIDVQPSYLDSYTNLGTEYLNKGMPDSAIAVYSRSLKINPTFAQAHYNIAQALVKQQRYNDAIGEFKTALDLNPSLADCWYNLGVAYEQVSDRVNAIEAYKRAIALRGDYLDAYVNLGGVYSAQSHPEMAIETFARALAIAPTSPEVYYNLGSVLFGVGDTQRARNAFEKAIQYNTSYAEAYHNLGVLFNNAGDHESAVLNFQKAARLGYESSRKILQSQGLTW